MPAQQALLCQRLGVVLRGFERHLHDAFDAAVRGDQAGDVHAQPTRYGGPDLSGIEELAFDLAGLEDVKRERLEQRLFLLRESECFHAPEQASLPVAHSGQRRGKGILIPLELRPIRGLMYVFRHYPHLMRILYRLFSAFSIHNCRN